MPTDRRNPSRRWFALALLVLLAPDALQQRTGAAVPYSAASAFAARSAPAAASVAGKARRAADLQSPRRRRDGQAARLGPRRRGPWSLGPLLAERGGGGGDASEKPAAAAKTDSNLSLEGAIFMALLALQFGVQPSLVKAYTPRGVIKSSVVLTQELVKFVIASVLYFSGTSKEQRKTDLSGMSIWTWLAIAGLPAALYNVQNIASLLAYQNLEPLTFNVLNQTKTLSAALCCYLVIGKKQSGMQMVSLGLLLVAALIIEKLVSLSAFSPPFFSGGSSLFATSSLFGAEGLARHVTHGVFPILLASFISGLAGAIVQKNLQGASKSGKKKVLPRNPYLFNMELNSASSLFLIASLFFSGDGKQMVQAGFFDNWTPRTLIPILTNAVGGIIVALVTKYAGAVRKGFALIFGILISGLIQAETAGITAEQVVGGLVAAASLYLHTMYPYKPKPKEVKDK